MNCPKCGCEKWVVTDSRRHITHITRRKECQKCGNRFTTIEIAELTPENMKSIYLTTDKRKFRKIIVSLYLKLFDPEEYLKRMKGLKQNENRTSKAE